MDFLVVVLLGVIAIVGVSAASTQGRHSVAAPLMLVLLGAGISFIPGMPTIEIEPEWILAGVLPPLLYSTAVSLPTMDFRRDFAAIGTLAVVLVIITSVVLGFVFSALLPQLGLAGGIALGAILSPTDAVATSITKRLGAPPRVVTVLEGEGLLNDASALVLLRSAIAATAATVSFGHIVADFIWAVIGAVLVGFAVGSVGLWARKKIDSSALTTAVSFIVPFVAYLPAERLGASGLVAVVVAGLVTGHGAAKHLTPQDRMFDYSNWHTAETLLEGGLFLLMGLEASTLVKDVVSEHGSLWHAVGVAALAGVIVLAVRALFVAPLLYKLRMTAEKKAVNRERFTQVQTRLDARLAVEGNNETMTFPPKPGWNQRPPWGDEPRVGTVSTARVKKFRTMLVRRAADIDYLVAKPLGRREGALIVWAGMRGVVTLAAALTLPTTIIHRSFLVLVAFGVAGGTLLVQGGTMPWVMRRLGIMGQGAVSPEEMRAVRAVMDAAGHTLIDNPKLRRRDGEIYDPTVVKRVQIDFASESLSDEAVEDETEPQLEQYRELQMRLIEVQRKALLVARKEGVHDARFLERSLGVLDAAQITLEMKTAGTASH
ncbi:MAG: sodium:proton antiporter [Cellulomonadaceae bacterium]|jgi:CPA1 family monovalent cation:H+ antiporter|nr:sodium:proton antiporter [Cellulomonadaceae bacterium]